METSQTPKIEKPLTASRERDGVSRLGIAAVTRRPFDILKDPDLTRTDKVLLLRDLAYDALERAVAEEEGANGGVASDVNSVMSALNDITHGFDVKHTCPTKHAAFAIR